MWQRSPIFLDSFKILLSVVHVSFRLTSSSGTLCNQPIHFPTDVNITPSHNIPMVLRSSSTNFVGYLDHFDAMPKILVFGFVHSTDTAKSIFLFHPHQVSNNAAVIVFQVFHKHFVFYVGLSELSLKFKVLLTV